MPEQDARSRSSTKAALTLLALGVVFGDIGTSPPLRGQGNLFARPRHSADAGQHPGRPVDDFLGADDRRVAEVRGAYHARRQPRRGRHHGAHRARDDGGQGAARTGACRWSSSASSARRSSTAMRFLTPAVTVLGAIEGLEVGNLGVQALRRADRGRRHHRAVQPAAKRHRGWWGRLFRAGHACCGFFAIGGLRRETASCSIPASWRRSTRCTRLAFITGHGMASFVVLGAVVLAVTGAEALYADMGHFGKGAVRIAWFSIVGAGAGAQLLRPGRAADRAARGGEEPVLPAAAGLGALSDGRACHRGGGDRLAGGDLGDLFAHQAGGAARLPAAHDHRAHLPRREIGQVYIPSINWVLCVAVLVAVVGFGSSSRLAGAYGRRGHRDDARRHAAHVLRDPLRLGLSAVGCAFSPPASSPSSTRRSSPRR